MPVTKNEDWEVLKTHYRSSYFFCSELLQKMEYYVLSLEKVRRQKDKDFINLLNNIRLGIVKAKDIDFLNTKYEPDFQEDINTPIVMLKVKNKETQNYNDDLLEKLKGTEKTYWADDDNWSPEKYPTSYKLVLKKGARVMFVKNDTRYGQYINGTMGYVEGLGDDYVKVRRDDSDRLIFVERQTWERLSYKIDKKTKRPSYTLSLPMYLGVKIVISFKKKKKKATHVVAL